MCLIFPTVQMAQRGFIQIRRHIHLAGSQLPGSVKIRIIISLAFKIAAVLEMEIHGASIFGIDIPIQFQMASQVDAPILTVFDGLNGCLQPF